MELEDIEREQFDGSLAKRQIHQYFPPSINCAIRYMHIVQLQICIRKYLGYFSENILK